MPATTATDALRHRREWLLSALFVVGGACAVLGGVSGAVVPPDRPLRVGANFWIGYEPLRFLPHPEGRPAPRIIELRSTSAVLEGLRSGTLDAAALTIDEAVRHSGPDLPLAIVLVLDRSDGADAVLARPGAAPVPGARFGVETEGVGALVLSRFLATVGLVEADVRIVDMPASAHDVAFTSGTVDYLVTYEPHVSALEAAGATRIFDSRRLPGEVIDVLVVRRDVLATRRSDVDALLAGWPLGLDRMRRDLATGSAAVARRLDIAPGDLDRILRGIAFPDPQQIRRMLTDGTLETTVADLAAWARSRGVPEAGRWLTVVPPQTPR